MPSEMPAILILPNAMPIAMAMARGTALTVFDEPEAGIDLWSFGNLIAVFEKMCDNACLFEKMLSVIPL